MSSEDGFEVGSAIDLQAQRYVSDDLSAAEVAEFEGALEDDQLAREALERAVLIAVALDTVEPAATTSPAPAVRSAAPEPWLRRSLVMLGAAATLLVMVRVGGRAPVPFGSLATSFETSQVESGSTALLVGRWLEFGREVEGTASLDGQPAAELDGDDVLAPAWMLSAVSRSVR